jgi:xanthine dehydrogenase YagS FAD-binding subunit
MMKNFEYAAPREEKQLLELLSPEPGHTQILAGGTDLVGLMKRMVLTPARVVNIKEVASLQGVSSDAHGVTIGAVTCLADVAAHPALADYPALVQAIEYVNSIQLQAQGTIGGELCQRPQCWYFRAGHGLLADGGRMVEQGDNRYHAILGNSGPAKFVSASRLAPALIALGATVRLIRAGQQDAETIPLEAFYRTPRSESERETILAHDQVLTHIHLPRHAAPTSASYEVRHGEGPDYPLAAAASWLALDGYVVREARVVLGHVAPVPWVSHEAVSVLLGRAVDEASAAAAGEAAVAGATPLSHNQYKVQLARVAVKRALLLAAGVGRGGPHDAV